MIPPIANQFVAGEDIDSGVTYAETLYERHSVRPILNLLGEHYDTHEEVTSDVDEYVELIERVGESDIPTPAVSVKPSQVGGDISLELLSHSLNTIGETAAEHDVFVWVDMESEGTVDRTLAGVKFVLNNTTCDLGVCLQANLKRTVEDVREIAGAPITVRLVKGAYSESEEVSYTEKSVVDEEYLNLIKVAFQEFDGTASSVAIGSHDSDVIEFARELSSQYSPASVEYQMLMGVREEYQYDLVSDGEIVYQYIPIGSKWFSYFYRRVRERKENALFAFRAVIGR